MDVDYAVDYNDTDFPFCSLFFLARAFSPTLRKYKEEGQNKKELATKLERSIWIYIILLMTMLWFMVGKPTFGDTHPFVITKSK